MRAISLFFISASSFLFGEDIFTKAKGGGPELVIDISNKLMDILVIFLILLGIITIAIGIYKTLIKQDNGSGEETIKGLKFMIGGVLWIRLLDFISWII